MKNMHHIGSLITHIRDIKGITQKELANEIGTSQSAIARIERGDQNITIDMVAKISKALNRQLLSFSGEVMSFQIKGGNKLHGTVTANTSKNATMALLAASILNKKTTIIRKAPRIEEVARMSEVLESIGFSLRWIDNDLEIKPPAVIDLKNCNEASALLRLLTTSKIFVFLLQEDVISVHAPSSLISKHLSRLVSV
jgi:UDP-N-acetylglucosamine 1-carboxyvinyltransferase